MSASAAPPAAAAPGPIKMAIGKFLTNLGNAGKAPAYPKANEAINSAGEWNAAIAKAAAAAGAPPPSIDVAIKQSIKQANDAADQYIQKVNDASGDKSKIDVITTDDLKAKYKAADDQLKAGTLTLGAKADLLVNELAAVKKKVNDAAKAEVLTGGRRRKATRKATKKSKKSRKTKKSKRSRKSKGRK